MHTVTVNYSPIHWIDEVHITEIARGGVGVKNTEWSVDLPRGGLEGGKMKSAIWWFGGFVNEIGFQLFGRCGARYIMLVFLVLGSVLLYCYINIKTGCPVYSLLVGLIYFSYPTLTQSARGARVDALAFFFIIAAILVLQIRPCSRLRRVFIPSAVGFCLVGSIFTWVTSIVLMPIVLWELLEHVKHNKYRVTEKISFLLIFLLIATICSLLFLSPFISYYDELPNFCRNLIGGVRGPSNDQALSFWKRLTMLICWLPLFAMIGCSLLFIKRRYVILSVGVVLFTLLNLITRVYCFRILYYLPYAIIGFIVFYNATENGRWKKWLVAIVAILMAFYYCRSIIARNAIEYLCKDYRNYNQLEGLFAKEVPPNSNVYVCTYELYYTGRTLGWKQYRYDFIPPSETPSDILEKCQYFIIKDTSSTVALNMYLRKYGYHLKSILNVAPDESNKGNMLRLIKVLRRNNLGPYVIFEKDT